MAVNATDIYRGFTDYHRLTPEGCGEVCGGAEFVRDVEASKRLVALKGPRVVISASGMATGGRVLHHLRALGPDARNTLLLPGFQAPGTRGADIAAGAERVRIHGNWVPIRAEVLQLDVLSAHADRDDLVEWVAHAPRTPRGIFVVHGEPSASDALRRSLEGRLGVEPRVPEHAESVELRGGVGG
jgi:metallo-beta-lactamase family protein